MTAPDLLQTLPITREHQTNALTKQKTKPKITKSQTIKKPQKEIQDLSKRFESITKELDESYLQWEKLDAGNK